MQVDMASFSSSWWEDVKPATSLKLLHNEDGSMKAAEVLYKNTRCEGLLVLDTVFNENQLFIRRRNARYNFVPSHIK
jgi:hypothetical protein